MRASPPTVMDPFCYLNKDVHQLILQHLTVADVKSFSFVSSQWYDIIGASKVCMDRVMLLPLAEVLIRSRRKYRNFIIERLEPTLFAMFKQKDYIVKHVQINGSSTCDHEIPYEELFTFIAPSVEVIQISHARHISKLASSSIDFPVLRKLVMLRSEAALLPIFAGKNPRLIEVSLDVDSAKDISLITKIYERNPQITNFEVPCDNYVQFLDYAHILDNFKLQRFELKTCIRRNMDTVAKLMETQRDLEEFSICRLGGVGSGSQDCRILPKVLNLVGNLKYLSLTGVTPHKATVDEIIPHLNIVELNFTPHSMSSFKMGEILIKFPNLQALSIYPLTKDTISFAAHNLMSLQVVQTSKLTSEVIEFYAALQNSDLPVNKNIKLLQRYRYGRFRNARAIEYHLT